MSNLVTEIVGKLQGRTKIAIAGPPGSGKTDLSLALCEALGWHVFHTDSMIGSVDWSKASVNVADSLQSTAKLIIEGTTVPRGLRKLLFRANFDPDSILVVWLPNSFDVGQEQSKNRLIMGKTIHTVWNQIKPYLQDKRVRIVERGDGAQP